LCIRQVSRRSRLRRFSIQLRDAVVAGLVLMLFSAGSAFAAPPVATDDSMTAMTGSRANVMVLANDSDPTVTAFNWSHIPIPSRVWWSHVTQTDFVRTVLTTGGVR
jgi:hypothetical protein